MSMEKFSVRPLKIKDACIVTLVEHGSELGSTIECFNVIKSLPKANIPQITVSRSAKNVIRGLHCSPHHKLVQCPVGRVFDVVVDLRPDSPTYLQWDGSWLDKTHHIYIPGYCGHGFFAAEDDSAVLYLQGGCFAPELDFSVKYDDPRIHVEWPKPIDSDKYVISQKDLNNPYITPELEANLKARQTAGPELARQIAAYTDFAIISPSTTLALPIFEAIQARKLKAHLCLGNGAKRDTLESELTALRPKVGVICIVDTNKTVAENFIGIMNVVHSCFDRKISLTILTDARNYPGSQTIEDIIRKECQQFVLYLAGQCLLVPKMSRAEADATMKRFADDIRVRPSFTDLGHLAETIVSMSIEGKRGMIDFVNPGTLSASDIQAFSASAQAKQASSAETRPEMTKLEVGKNASEAFAELSSTFI